MTDVKKVQSGNQGGEGDAPLSSTGPVATELPSNAYVTGNLNSQFKYMQTDDGPFQEMSKGASLKPNKYLEKIAMSAAAKNFGKAFHEASPLNRASFAVSTAGLGMSIAGYKNGKTTAQASSDKADLERKSLSALNKINKTLTTATVAPTPNYTK